MTTEQEKCECWENHAIADVDEASCGCDCHEFLSFDEFEKKEIQKLERKRIENIIARSFHDHKDKEKDKECAVNKALRGILIDIAI